MPNHDPVPPNRPDLRSRFWRIFRLLALLSAVVAAIAVVLVSLGQEQIRIHLIIATGLGIGLTMLVGSALMTLVFLSASSGHDEAAGRTPQGAEREDDE